MVCGHMFLFWDICTMMPVFGFVIAWWHSIRSHASDSVMRKINSHFWQVKCWFDILMFKAATRRRCFGLGDCYSDAMNINSLGCTCCPGFEYQKQTEF